MHGLQGLSFMVVSGPHRHPSQPPFLFPHMWCLQNASCCPMKAPCLLGILFFKATPSSNPPSACVFDETLCPVTIFLFLLFSVPQTWTWCCNYNVVLKLGITCLSWPSEPAQVVTWIQLRSRGAISSARRLPAPSEGSLLYLCSHTSPMKHSSLPGEAVQDIEPRGIHYSSI